MKEPKLPTALQTGTVRGGDDRGFRKDLNGLRAVSVTFVVLYHAGLSGLAGGYVGVDAFFVLSGYFMSKMIGHDLARQQFSFVAFYLRRARRILPALIVMAAATSVFAYLYLMPEELKSYARSLRATTLFYSNLQFARESGYFDVASELKPLLHTWSLSVKEQFYLIFPLFAFASHKLRQKPKIFVYLAIISLSLLASETVVQFDQQKAFFGLPYRLWEMMLGALTASISFEPGRFAREGLVAAGLCLLMVAGIFFSATTSFPGFSALVPCVATTLLIIGGRRSAIANVTLGNPACQFLGKISYSIYLWHWPVVVFLPYVLGDLAPTEKTGAICIASIICGWASWRFIEQPFRFRLIAFGRPKVAFSTYLVIAGLFVSLSTIVIENQGLPYRLSEQARLVYAARGDTSRFLERTCFADPDGEGLSAANVRTDETCALGGSSDPVTFVLWGDSHAGAIAPALDLAAKRGGLSGVFVGSAGCPPFASARLVRPDRARRCDDFNAAAEEMISRRGIRDVVLVAYWRKYLSITDGNERVSMEGSLTSTSQYALIKDRLSVRVMALQKNGVKVWLMLDVPDFNQPVPESLARLAMLGRPIQLELTKAAIETRQGVAQDLVQGVGKNTGASVLDPAPWLCDVQACKAVLNGTVLYKDGDHLSASGARLLSGLFDPVISNLKLK